MIRTSAYSFILILATFLLLAGCDGAAGPDGEDSPDQDITAPQLEIVRPLPGELIAGSKMMLEAVVSPRAPEDENAIERVRFYVNGTTQMGEDSAIVTQSPFIYEWDFEVAGTAYGQVTITAEAVDMLGNSSLSALRLITRRELVGIDTLVDTNGPGTTSSVNVPGRIIQETDTIYATQVATRFLTYERCLLKEIRLLPVQRVDSYENLADFWVTIHAVAEDDSLHPGEPLDSTLVHPEPLGYDRWLSIDLADMSEDKRTFETEQGFFIAIRPEVLEPDSMDTGLTLGSLLEADTSEVAAEETVYWYESPPEGAGWIPMSTRHLQKYIQHLNIEAVIEYLPEETVQ
ncbi:MAG TPA: hypothetical protein ENH10_01330 [Bacteroidetes bacterium]|nr:hypothetical protein BMS3Bbin04_01787 [bacterium BMS3Bbin04]HDO64662.1 hypothetical protein [Bacteroidota bacterium]HEX03787.1 hypothetical protein [Bacteroidota bacterium]